MDVKSIKYLIAAISLVAFGLFAYHMVKDRFESMYHGYDYYFSESALFSIIWILIIPAVFIIYHFRLYRLNSKGIVVFILLFSFVHIVVYAFLIWLFSLTFLNHTYHILGNLQYAFLQFFIILCVIYFSIILLLKYYDQINLNIKSKLKPKVNNKLLIGDQNKKIQLDYCEILYIKANTPYIEINTKAKKYLQQGTLKDIIQRLDANIFIRVHKSAILNVNEVKSFVSRMNGDYDILMNNGDIIRLSRNYAHQFKTHIHPVTQDKTLSTQVTTLDL